MRRVVRALGVLAVLAITAASAAAAGVRESVPANGQTLATVPWVRLEFDEPVDQRACQVLLVGPGRREVLLLKPRSEAGGRVLTYRVPSLAKGEYKVRWKVMGADGRASEGELAFSVMPGP
jgi:methionine-rich copper-binding protein CopC